MNTPVAGYCADFFWHAQRLIVETDGRGTHLTRRGCEEDRARDAHHTALGFRVVRFTYVQVSRRPEWVSSMLRRLLLLSPDEGIHGGADRER